MTSYNERLDDIVHDALGEVFCGDCEHTRCLNKVKLYKQAITSLIKELVAEAKPPAIDASSRIKLYADDEGQMWYDRGQNDTIARFEQNLLKALEEV